MNREDKIKIIKKHQEKITKVNVIAIANDLGIKVYTATLHKDISGAIRKEDGQYVILINRSEGKYRQRFTIAHEIAHFVLHYDSIDNELKDIKVEEPIMYRSRLSNDLERQANKLAAEILMPFDLINKHYKDGIEDVSDIAEHLEVSKTALDIRLQSLALPSSVELLDILKN